MGRTRKHQHETQTTNAAGNHSTPREPAPSTPNDLAYFGIAPSAGPVFLEGRLVLSLSFQDCGSAAQAPTNEAEILQPLERYEIWDDLTDARFSNTNIELIRFDEIDVVVHGEGEESHTWAGQMDVSKRIILVPDLDTKGFKTNQAHDLRWKRVWSAASSNTRSAHSNAPAAHNNTHPAHSNTRILF